MLYHPIMKSLDSFLNKCIKSLLVVNIIIMLIIGGFFVQSVFADGSIISIPSPSSSVFANNLATTNILNNKHQITYIDAVSSDYSLTFTTFSDGDYVKGVYYSSVPGASFVNHRFYANDTSSMVGSGESIAISQTSESYAGYFREVTLTSSSARTESILPAYFDSLDSALSALTSPSVPSVSYEGFRLPAGYAAAIQGSNVSFDLSVDMPEYSSIKQWAYSTQRYGLESSLPSVSSFDYDYGTRIIWHVVGDTNLLGEGYHAAASLSQSVGSGFLMLVNPTYYGSTASIMSADMFNSAVTLSNVSGVSSIRLYSLGSYIGSGGITSDITTNGAIHGGAVISSGGAFFIDNGDGSFTPINSLPDYGDTSVDGSNSGLIAKFRALLEGFVESIESLLVAPVSYIQRIIAAGQTFFTWLSGLWTWLPADVSGILTAVLYVMAVVGALKLLWR